MKLEHLSLILGLTKSELKKRLELGLIDQQILNRQINEYSNDIRLDVLCDAWQFRHDFEQIDKYETQEKIAAADEIVASQTQKELNS